MGYYVNSPDSFDVVNKDQDPIPLVKVDWNTLTTSDLRSDYLLTNNSDDITNSLDWLSMHYRSMIGYRLHRGLSDDFTPTGESAGNGNCIADESTLIPNVGDYTDYSIVPDTTYFYKLCVMYNE